MGANSNEWAGVGGQVDPQNLQVGDTIRIKTKRVYHKKMFWYDAVVKDVRFMSEDMGYMLTVQRSPFKSPHEIVSTFFKLYAHKKETHA